MQYEHWFAFFFFWCPNWRGGWGGPPVGKNLLLVLWLPWAGGSQMYSARRALGETGPKATHTLVIQMINIFCIWNFKLSKIGVLERERLQRRVAAETWQEVERGEAQVDKMFEILTIKHLIYWYIDHQNIEDMNICLDTLHISQCIFRRVEVRVDGLADQFEVQDGCLVLHHPRWRNYTFSCFSLLCIDVSFFHLHWCW